MTILSPEGLARGDSLPACPPGAKVLLLYPRPWPGKTMSGRLPYALLILRAALEAIGCEGVIIDERVVPDTRRAIEAHAATGGIVCCGISAFTGVQVGHGLDMARIVRDVLPGVPIVWGGWHPSCEPGSTLRHELVDFVVRGQGEETFPELVCALALSDRDALRGMPGLSHKLDGAPAHNPPRPLTGRISDLRLDLRAVDVPRYIFSKPFADRSEKSIGIITSLGCPHNCAFCAVAGVYNRRVAFRSMDHIMEEIDLLVGEHGVDSLTIDDDNFFSSRKRVLDFCQRLLERGHRVSWDAGVSARLALRHFSDEDFQLIKRSGCAQLYIGAESGSDRVLEQINKKASVAETYEFVARLGRLGIKASISTMVGLPNAPADEAERTLDMILRCRELNDQFDYRLFFYTPYPSTPLYDQALASGWRAPDTLEGWSGHTLRRFKAPWLPRGLRRKVKYFSFYYYPYAFGLSPKPLGAAAGARVLEAVIRLLFENRLLQGLAAWRVRRRCFRFPLDAAWAVLGARARSLYGWLVHGNVDPFREINT